MFSPGDPKLDPLLWGPGPGTTEHEYDEDLAAFLGDLACGRFVPEAQVQGVARRAVGIIRIPRQFTTIETRLYAERLAARLTSADCPPGRALPDDLRSYLEHLAAGVAVNSCETPRCGLMRRLGAARAAPL